MVKSNNKRMTAAVRHRMAAYFKLYRQRCVTAQRLGDQWFHPVDCEAKQTFCWDCVWGYFTRGIDLCSSLFMQSEDIAINSYKVMLSNGFPLEEVATSRAMVI